MSFACLAQPKIDEIVDRFGNAHAVTLVVGAGASMEANLPSWRELVRRLLVRAARESMELATGDAEAWAEYTLTRDDLLAAAAIAETLVDDDLEGALPTALYGSEGAARFEPGPIAAEIARLRACFGNTLTLLTTNYDDLIERALMESGMQKARVRSYVQRQNPPDGVVGVTHLHGFAGRDGRPRRLVLTEEHYHRMQRRSSWQEKLVTEHLARSHCLFVGTTLTDPNLIRYVYGSAPGRARHAAVFVRQDELDGVDPVVRRAREQAVEARWGRCGVNAVFVDHFADAAQLVHEIGLRKRCGEGYRPVKERAARAIGAIESALRQANPDDFARLQVALSARLRLALDRMVRSAIDGSGGLGGERLAMALWLLGQEGDTITAWAHSDRAHQDPSTITAVPLHSPSSSRWIAVRAICRGGQLDGDLDDELSRWRFIRGLPLVLERPTRLPLGCITISSTKPRAESVLETLPESAKAELHRSLVASITEVLQPFADQFGR